MVTSPALVVCQVSVVGWPAATVFGFAVRVAVGAGGGGGGGAAGGAGGFLFEHALPTIIIASTTPIMAHFMQFRFTYSSNSEGRWPSLRGPCPQPGYGIQSTPAKS